MLTQRKRKISPEEYLRMERAAETRSEYLDGEIFAMAGASRAHNQIAANLVRLLGNQLLGKPCSVYASDMKVWAASARKYAYPDVVLACREEQFADENQDILLNPVVIIEVLSDSTEAHDRGDKFFYYRQIDSLREYLLVSQANHRVERFLRQAGNLWLYSEFHLPEDEVRLESVGCVINLGDVYDKVWMEGGGRGGE